MQKSNRVIKFFKKIEPEITVSLQNKKLQINNFTNNKWNFLEYLSNIQQKSNRTKSNIACLNICTYQ